MTGDQHLTTPHDSLVGMAELKRLPRHQYMDSATVDWIEEHRPLFEARGEPRLTALRPLSRRVLSHAVIPAAWFADPRLADSIHGVRHGARVAALAALLAESGRFDDVTTCTAVVAAAIHDCRRAHDQDDRGHGERAGRWFIRDSATVVARFGLPARMVRVRRAAIAARLHEIPYAEFTAHDEREYLRAQTVTDVLKSADALDRYRLPKKKWWPDDQLVRSHVTERLKEFAFDLVVDTERARAKGVSSAVGVLAALGDRGMV